MPSKNPRPVVLMKVADLIPYEKNAKIHDEEQVQKIANSIKKFGFRGSISVTKDNVIINGHGRVLATKLLKLKTIPCVVEDDMSEEEIKAFRLADNKTNEGGYDADLLSNELMELSEFENLDMGDFFSEKEMSFSLDDMGEIDESGLSEDLKDEVDAIADATTDLVDDADGKRYALGKVFGFNDIGSSTNRSLKKFVSLTESETGLTGEKALKAYLADFMGM